MPDDRPAQASIRNWEPAPMTAAKRTAFDWVKAHAGWLSERHREVWDFHETAWREYKSAAWYVKLLCEQGFEVEQGTAGMPTAFRARCGKGKPEIASYAECGSVWPAACLWTPWRGFSYGTASWLLPGTASYSA